MEFEFFKLRVCGNDLILVSFLDSAPPEPSVLSPLSRKICHRVRGVGGSGAVYLTAADEGRVHLRHYLPGGEESNVYPDALVCACRYLFDSGHTDPDTVRFLESGRDRDVRVVDSNHFTVRMGEPVYFDGSPVVEKTGGEQTRNITVGGKTVVTTPLNMIRPSAVVFIGEEPAGSLQSLSAGLSEEFSASAGVQPVFARVYGRDDIRIHLHFHRRVKDYISAAGAAAVAAVINGFCDRQVLVRSGRNDLYVRWDGKTNEVSVTASSAYTFSGYFYYENPKALR